MNFAKLTYWMVNLVGWIPIPVWDREPKRSEVFQ